jgi:hypothetical protein
MQSNCWFQMLQYEAANLVIDWNLSQPVLTSTLSGGRTIPSASPPKPAVDVEAPSTS